MSDVQGTENGTEVALVPYAGEQFVALATEDPERLDKLLRTNLGGALDASLLDALSVPTGGARNWELDTAFGEGAESTPTLEVIIVAMHDARIYYEKSMEEAKKTGEVNQPDCISPDGVFGNGKPGGKCKDCPYSKWGSKGKGQACAQRKQLLLAMPGKLIPLGLSIPPTSVRALDKYMMRLSSNDLFFYEVVTAISLEKVEGTYDYSRCVFTVSGTLDEATRSNATAYSETMTALVQQAAENALTGNPAAEEARDLDQRHSAAADEVAGAHETGLEEHEDPFGDQ